MKTENITKTIANLIALLSVAVGGAFRAAFVAAAACVKIVSRVFVALALCVSAPVVANDNQNDLCSRYEYMCANRLTVEINHEAKHKIHSVVADTCRKNGGQWEERPGGGGGVCGKLPQYFTDDEGYAKGIRCLVTGMDDCEFGERPGIQTEDSTPAIDEPSDVKRKQKESYDGALYSAAVIIADGYLPSWISTQTFAFSDGNQFTTGQVLSIPLNNFTFETTRVQVNNAADYEFGVKWEMEF